MEAVKLHVLVAPLSVQTDFEPALFGAFKQALPETLVLGFYFHFKQNFWRHIQALGLARAYKELQNPVRLACNLLACIAFVNV